MKILFFGSSDFSLPALKASKDFPSAEVRVVTTPPRKQGRGLRFEPTPVASWAQANRIPAEAPENLRDPELKNKIETWSPDLFVVSSYGKLIPASWISIPKKYSLNVHPSLLPKYRGASPIQWSILNGDSVTGLSIADVTKDLDAGDIFFQEEIPLSPDLDAAKLSRLLSERSYTVLQQLFKQIEENRLLSRKNQDGSKASYARKLEKKDGLVQWNEPAEIIQRKIRALFPWPGTVICIRGENVKLLRAEVLEEPSQKIVPGTLLEVEKEKIHVSTGKGVLVLQSVQPEGKRQMTAAEYARGRRLEKGNFLTQENPKP